MTIYNPIQPHTALTFAKPHAVQRPLDPGEASVPEQVHGHLHCLLAQLLVAPGEAPQHQQREVGGQLEPGQVPDQVPVHYGSGDGNRDERSGNDVIIRDLSLVGVSFYCPPVPNEFLPLEGVAAVLGHEGLHLLPQHHGTQVGHHQRRAALGPVPKLGGGMEHRQ